MPEAVTLAPVLWSLSRLSGPLFQVPLFEALRTASPIWTVSSAAASSSLEFARSRCSIGQPDLGSFPSAVFRLPGEKRRLEQSVRDFATIVHVTMATPFDALLLPARKRTGVPVVITVHDHERHLGEKNGLLDRLDARIFAKADHLVTLSRTVHAGVMQRRPDIPVHLVEDGLATRTRRGLAARTGYAGGMPRLLFVGRIHPYKGVDLLLDALALLAKQGVAVECTVAGAGETGDLETRLAMLPNVTLINRWLSDGEVENLLADHDILVLPYREATQSGVAIDAQWAALPAVATPVGALPEQFDSERTAIFATEVSAEALASAIGRLATNVNLYRALSAASHEAYRKLDFPALADRWLQFYASIVPHGRQHT